MWISKTQLDYLKSSLNHSYSRINQLESTIGHMKDQIKNSDIRTISLEARIKLLEIEEFKRSNPAKYKSGDSVYVDGLIGKITVSWFNTMFKIWEYFVAFGPYNGVREFPESKLQSVQPCVEPLRQKKSNKKS